MGRHTSVAPFSEFEMYRSMTRNIVIAAFAIAVPMAASAPVAAQTVALPADTAAAGQFISSLADRVFAVLKETGSKPVLKARFRALLKENFAVDEAGARLIRRYRNQITPAQLAAYQAVLPDYVVNVYADRLINYADADVKIIRSQPRGPNGNVDVFSRIGVPGKQPLDITWAVEKAGGNSKWLINNVTVSGVNLSLTQEADFSAYIAKNGFDALVAMMKASNSRSA